MSRYFFDVLRDGRFVCDGNGDDLADDGEVRDMVVALLVDMAQEQVGDRDSAEVTISTRDAEGRPVYKASLAFVGVWGTGR